MAEFKKHTVELDPEKVAAFRAAHPGSSLKWFFDECLEKYVKLSTEDKLLEKIDQTFDKTVKSAMKRIEEGGSNDN